VVILTRPAPDSHAAHRVAPASGPWRSATPAIARSPTAPRGSGCTASRSPSFPSPARCLVDFTKYWWTAPLGSASEQTKL